MTTRFDCGLDGVLLSSLNDRICVLNIREEAPRMRTAALSLFPEGQRLLQQQWDKLTLHIDFAIQQEDPVLRQEALLAVHAWARQGGVLTVPHRPGQRLTVVCAGLPAASAEDWTETLTLTFQSSRVPYWEAASKTTINGVGELSLTIPGTGGLVPVDVLIFNAQEETFTSMTLRTGDTRMTFEGIDFYPGSLMVVHCSDPQEAVLNGDSILSCLTADSDDLLLLPCGEGAAVSVFSGETPMRATFAARGRFA